MKMSRRLGIAILLFGALSSVAQPDFASYVNPFVGTDFNGHTFPGATTPFGMVQLSPDTRIDGSWQGCSGYHYSDSVIYGFSHTHLSGTGVSDYGDILIMPQLVNDVQPSFDPLKYSAQFSHENEHAEAGYYSVQLNNGIQAELTATTRVGFHRYRFPDKEFALVIDLQHRDRLVDNAIEIIDDQTIAIKRVSTAWAREQHCYSHLTFSLPFEAEINQDSTKLLLRYKHRSKELLVRAGISFTGTYGAKINQEKELNHWDFDKCWSEAKATWNSALGKIKVTDNDSEKLKVFYTALYHTMIHPNVAMDVDGNYRGMDNKIHKARDFTYYTVFSLWDTFRATHPLYTIIEQKRTLDFIKTFLAMFEQGGRLPVWELCSNETDCMIGYHSVSVIADAMVKNIDQFDQQLAFKAMKKSANWKHLGLPEYKDFGFLSVDHEHESVSKTLEYAYDDWCIAQMAERLGEKQDFARYTIRSNAWRNLLDPETKFMRPRANGDWLKPFEPREVNNHFTEGNSWQYSFFVPHDVEGMIEAMGGPVEFESKLDSLFSAPTQTTGRTQPDISGMIGQYAHGNEPSHHIAYLYNYLGKPDKTKQMIHRILKEFYTSKPDGLIGNEDCGQMSAWYVMSAMGLYAVKPGEPTYQIVEPYLDDYVVNLENGQTFNRKEISEALENNRTYISHYEVMNQLVEVREAMKLPEVIMPSPIIRSSGMSFVGKHEITISVPEGYGISYREQNATERQYVDSTEVHLTIDRSTIIEAYAYMAKSDQRLTGKPVVARFYKRPHPDWKINLKCTYNPQYSAGGPVGLIDGIKGDKNWRKGYWQGYQDQDFEVILEMDSVTTFQYINTTFLQDTRSWIIYPTNVSYSYSLDGINFTELTTLEHDVEADDYYIQIRGFKHFSPEKIEAKFIKVYAKNYGELPGWHQGAGGKAFIFVDEIDIE